MYKRILVPLDGSELAECVLEHAVAIAVGKDAELALLTVVDSFEKLMMQTAPASSAGVVLQSMAEVGIDTARQMAQAQADSAREYLDALSERLRDKGTRVTPHVVEGRAAETILIFAQDGAFDLIAIATHGRSGLTRTVLGSVADEVMRESHLPVLMIHPPE